MSDPSSVMILFVGGDAPANSPLVDALRREGYAVEPVGSGPGPAEGPDRKPSLVILDGQLDELRLDRLRRRCGTAEDTTSVLVLPPAAEPPPAAPAPGPNGCAHAHVRPSDLVSQVRTLLDGRRAGEALRASEARFQDILDHAPVVVYVKDLEGRYLLVNRHWEDLFGQARADVVGKTSHDVFGAEKADALRANDLKALAARGPLEFEEVLPHADGPHTYLSCKFALRDGAGSPYALCGVSTDITGRKRAELALRDSEALYHSLVEALPVQLFRKDPAGRFTFANGPFCRSLGRTRAEVLGRCDEDLYPEARARKYAADDRRVLDTGEVLEEIEEQPGPDGESQYLQVLKAPVRDASGRTAGMQGIFWDVTARKRAEEELARTAVELRVARRIQQKLFPAETPRVAGLDIGSASFPFDIGGASYPAEAIGGDYFDYLALAGGCLGVAVGDVSGHGIGPALLMAIARAYLRASAQGQADVGSILGQVNRLLVEDVEGDRFITLLFARLDPKARTLSYASAGHTAGYVLDRSGAVKHSLESTGIPLGIEAGATFPCGPPVTLDPGDLVLLLTDGVVETRDPQGAPFGARRALDLVRVYRKATARQVVDNLYHAVRAFAQNMPQYDDITATVIKVGGLA